ncbi:hypothetical protein IKQ21_00440 [bacterium]|nr:hypothetical protein [bacterium]
MAKKVQTIDVNSLDKDIVIPANTKNAEIYFKNLNNFNDLTFSGGSAENPATNNLTILVNGHKITLTNYFAKNGSFAVKTIKTDSETTQSVNLIDYVNEHQIRGVYQNIVNAMTKTVNGTVFDDIITPLGDKQTVNAGNGNDLIYADGGNDTLIGGLGTNEVKFEYYATPFPEQKSFGQDIIKLTKGETLNLNIKYDDSTPVNLTFSKGSGKGANDLIITNDANPEDKITIQNYYGKETGATVLINGKDLSEESADFITYNFNEDSIIKSSTVKGSALADTIDASDAQSLSELPPAPSAVSGPSSAFHGDPPVLLRPVHGIF